MFKKGQKVSYDNGKASGQSPILGVYSTLKGDFFEILHDGRKLKLRGCYLTAI